MRFDCGLLWVVLVVLGLFSVGGVIMPPIFVGCVGAKIKTAQPNTSQAVPAPTLIHLKSN